jgi:plastocyanin
MAPRVAGCLAMSTPASRTERRAAALEERQAHRRRGGAAARARLQRRDRIGRLAFGAVITVVLAVGAYLAFGDFLGRSGPAAGAISVQASMAGFTPSEIHVKTGRAVNLDFWTQDSPGHLRDGVHTMISEELGLQVELPGAAAAATSRVSVDFTAPATAGTYDIYCDTCCGGRESPTMHGKVVVEA